MFVFNRTYRGYPQGYVLKDGEVSEAQLMLFKKRGVIERSGASYPIKDENSSYYTLSNGGRVNGEETQSKQKRHYMADFFDPTNPNDLKLLHSSVRDNDELANVVDQVEWEIINHYKQRPQGRSRVRSGKENLTSTNAIKVMLIDYNQETPTDSPSGLKDALRRTIADVVDGILLNYNNERGVQSKRQGQRAISYRGANPDSRTWPSGWSYRLKNYDGREATYGI